MANSLISMIKGDSTLIDNTEVLDGQLLLDETNKKIYLDDNNERIDFSQGGGETSSDANLAYVEEGTVATRGYAAGAYVIVEGQLYKTLTQINSGTTFITEGVNANVKATNIGSEVTQLNNDLTAKVSGFTETTYSAVTGLAYDSTNKKLGLKVGADTVIPFSSSSIDDNNIIIVTNRYANESIEITTPSKAKYIFIHWYWTVDGSSATTFYDVVNNVRKGDTTRSINVTNTKVTFSAGSMSITGVGAVVIY